MEEDKIKKTVREGYTKIAKSKSSCCGTTDSLCCSSDTGVESSKEVGYSEEELSSIPDGAILGLGCGNPVALASLKEGETVLDLGSGAGIDCFLAANKVGEKGKVIGVDMTSEMIDRARENVKKGKYKNVDFRLGEIENLPVADGTVDIVISNCVINLSPNKKRVFEEAFRVLKPGGRLMVSDIVLLKELPEKIRKNVEAYIGCLSGAEMKEKYLQLIKEAGYQKVNIVKEEHFSVEDMINDPIAQTIVKSLEIPVEKIKEAGDSAASVTICGVKPK